MKIIYLFNSRLPTEKAYGIQVAKMCEAFADNGHEVKLLYPHRKNPTISQDIFSYYSIKNNFSLKEVKSTDFYFPGLLDKAAFIIKSYFSAKALTKEALKENANIYYTRDELVAYFLSKQNKNVIFECHRFSNKRKKFYSHFKKINLKIVVISDGLKGDLIKFGIKDSNIQIARDGVDLSNFNVPINAEERKEEQKRLREEFFTYHFDFYRRKKIAVYIGSLYSWKGANILISVAEYLKQLNDNYLVWVVGGTDKNIEMLEKGMHPNIVPFIYDNAVPHKEVVRMLIAADCAILTGKETDSLSAKYTSPLKMFEYMASGCPIVAQDLPSFREVLNDGNSFLVRPGDAKAMADKIDFVFRDENEKIVQEKAVRAFEDVKNYTWQKRIEKIINFA